VNAEDEHTGVESVVVFCGEDVDVGEVRGRKEDGPRDRGIHDDRVAVEPTIAEVSIRLGC